MVLQHHEKCLFWGASRDGQTVRLTFRGRSVDAVSQNGHWRAEIAVGDPGGPFPLTVQSASSTLEIKEIYVGEVWLVAGQSNAAQSCDYGPPQDGSRVVRYYRVTADCKGLANSWVAAGNIPIVAWNFGQRLEASRGVPVGIICCAVGGTCIEQWRPVADPSAMSAGPGGELGPARELYDKWIASFLPYRIKGVVWWQGESNANNVSDYLMKFKALISEWRTAWGQGALPFVWVQLQRVEDSGPDWLRKIAAERARLADAQRRALAVPNTAMVCTYDITAGDLHPSYAEKEIIAKRLVLAAEALVYGQPEDGFGPLPGKAEINGGDLTVSFAHAVAGLKAVDNVTTKGRSSAAGTPAELRGFEIHGTGASFVPANASIDGNSVRVSVAGLKRPVVLRYAWGPMPVANLCNAAGLPAPTFQLDPIR